MSKWLSHNSSYRVIRNELFSDGNEALFLFAASAFLRFRQGLAAAARATGVQAAFKAVGGGEEAMAGAAVEDQVGGEEARGEDGQEFHKTTGV